MSSRAYALSSSFPTKLQVSDDLGVTWSEITPTGLPTNPSDMKDIASDPYYAYNVLVCGYNGTGVRFSTNAGVSFTTIPGTAGLNFDKVLFQSSTVLWAFGDLIYRSSDSGTTWVNTGISPSSLYGSAGAKVSAVFSEFAEPGLVYIGINEKLFSSASGNTWVDLGSSSVIPVGDKITSIYANNSIYTVTCSDGVYYNSPSVAWGSTLSLGYSTPYSNYLGFTPNSSTVLYLLDAYGDIYKSTDSGLNWSGVLSTISLTATPPITQGIKMYTPTTYVVYTDVPSKIYRSTNNGVTNTLIDTFSSDVIGLTGSYDVTCLECPSKFEYSTEYSACIGVDPTSIYLCPEGYSYDFNTNTCIPEEGPSIPAEGLYSDSLCQIVDITGRGVAECDYLYYVNPCGYILTPCDEASDPIYTVTDLSDYLSNIITIQGSNICYTISESPEGIFPNYIVVLVNDVFENCSECLPKYPLYNCNDTSVVIYTQSNFSEYVGQTVSVSAYPNECWQVGPAGDFAEPVVSLSVTNSYATCLECNPIKYQLVNCLNNESFIVSDSELADYVGKVIRVQGIPGICFTVQTDLCDCVKVETRLETYTANKISELNGRNVYSFIESVTGDQITLLWSATDSQWQFLDESGTVLSYSPLDTPCPFISYWITSETSPIENMVVTGCYDVIYDITVENSFPNCDYCVNC